MNRGYVIAVGRYAMEISYCYVNVIIFLYEFRKKVLNFLICYKTNYVL